MVEDTREKISRSADGVECEEKTRSAGSLAKSKRAHNVWCPLELVLAVIPTSVFAGA